MKTNYDHTQLALNFRRPPRAERPVDRILKNFRKLQRTEYFRKIHYLRRDKFISMFGTQIF
jgi:hypothetical protein